jgi:hypothetical protein
VYFFVRTTPATYKIASDIFQTKISLIRQRLYSSSPGPECFFSFVIHAKSVGLIGWEISPVARPLPTHNDINTDKHLSLEWDSNL